MEQKQVFNCPNCSTPIEETDANYLVCPYCGIVLQNDGGDLEEYSYE